MKDKSIGRPAVYYSTSLRMTKATRKELKQLSRDTGIKQGKLIEMALKLLRGTVGDV